MTIAGRLVLATAYLLAYEKGHKRYEHGSNRIDFPHPQSIERHMSRNSVDCSVFSV